MKKDLTNYIREYIKDIAVSHLEAWKDRYQQYGGNKRRMEEDLYINHDSSIEIENAEQELKRKLSGKEAHYLEERFNDEVICQWEIGNWN